MKMKRILAVALALAMGLSMISCGQSTEREETQPQQTEQVEQPAKTPEEKPAEKPTEKTKVNLAALSGPTALGMLELLEQNEKGKAANDYQVTLATAPDEVVAKVVSGELDIAAVPTNVAATLYNKTQGGVQLAALNTMGVLYILEKGDSIQSMADLRGKTIYASGKGATPEYALNYILEQNGLTPGKDVTIEWKSEHAECVAALTSDEDGIAMLPQPFVATAQAKNSDIRIALDLTEEWDAVQQDEANPSSLLTGVVIARTEFIENRPEELDAFLNSYGDSVKFVNENTEEAAELIGEYNIVPAAVAVKALPYCNIVLIESTDMKEKLSGYLSVLFEQNPKSVGGQLPGDAFYYGV